MIAKYQDISNNENNFLANIVPYYKNRQKWILIRKYGNG